MNLKRGLIQPTRSVALKFGAVFKNLPDPPAAFGHYQAIPAWGMLLNNRYSDCVVAGACHETMLWGSMAGHTIQFADGWVWKDYQAMQGNPSWPFNDRGLDMQAAADFRRRIGVHDRNGIRHRIIAYLDLPLSDPKTLAQAVDALGAVGVGLNLPANAEAAWAQHQPWKDTSQPPSGEGHYVSCVGRKANGNFVVVTWGSLQEMDPDFYSKYNGNMISLAYLSLEQLNDKGLTPDQFDRAKLESFLTALG